MADNIFTAGVAKCLLFSGQDLIGYAQTLSDSTFSASITAEEIRGGQGNLLYGQYFHDSNIAITLTDAMFNISYVAANLGVNLEQGGISIVEEELTVGAVGGALTLTQTPVAFDGAYIGWYKKPSDADWTIGTIDAVQKKMNVAGAKTDEHYCVKYFYQNESAKSITIKAQFVPKVLHLVMINDLFSGSSSDVAASTSKYGRLITDIPNFQLDGAIDLSWAAASAATVSLSGKALAYSDSESCETDPVYGTMTQEIFGADWRDEVYAIAIENPDVDLAQNGTETLIVRALFKGAVAPQRKDNANFTFAIENAPASTATGTTVGANTGIVTAGTTDGTAIVSVTLTNYPNVPPAYATVTVG